MLHPSTCYHIYNHGNGDDNLFREERNYVFFLSKLKFHTEAYAELIAWCLMPNHFHLLVRIKQVEEIIAHPKFGNHPGLNKPTSEGESNLGEDKKIEKILGFENLDGLVNKRINQSFSNFFNSYTKAFNKTYGRRVSLFLKNYKRKEIDSDDYFRTLIH